MRYFHHKKFARGIIEKFLEVMYFLANISSSIHMPKVRVFSGLFTVSGVKLSKGPFDNFTRETVDTFVLW